MKRNLLEEFLAGSLAYCQNDVCAVRHCLPASNPQAKVDFFFFLDPTANMRKCSQRKWHRAAISYLFIYLFLLLKWWSVLSCFFFQCTQKYLGASFSLTSDWSRYSLSILPSSASPPSNQPLAQSSLTGIASTFETILLFCFQTRKSQLEKGKRMCVFLCVSLCVRVVCEQKGRVALTREEKKKLKAQGVKFLNLPYPTCWGLFVDPLLGRLARPIVSMLVKQSSKFRFGHCCSVTLPGLDCLGFRRLCLWGERESSVYLLPTKPRRSPPLSSPPLLPRRQRTCSHSLDTAIPSIGRRRLCCVCVRLAESVCVRPIAFPVCVGLSLSSLCRTPAPCLCASASFTMDGISSFSTVSLLFVCLFNVVRINVRLIN